MAEDIIKDITVLQDISSVVDCDNLEDGKLLAQELFKSLAQQKTAPAIAANQIGINKRIIVLSVREPIYLINPQIISATIQIPYLESHASFPQKLFTTIRYASITIKADNVLDNMCFGVRDNQRHLLYSGKKINAAVTTHPVIMEAVYVQQAIDTLNGIMPMAREMVMQSPVCVEKTPSRNELITISNGAEVKILKYKKAEWFINNGWIIQ